MRKEHQKEVMFGYSGDSELVQSSISTLEKKKILCVITDERQRKVCSFVLRKVGYPYSQANRDSSTRRSKKDSCL